MRFSLKRSSGATTLVFLHAKVILSEIAVIRQEEIAAANRFEWLIRKDRLEKMGIMLQTESSPIWSNSFRGFGEDCALIDILIPKG
jgi:hypothetical protein